MDIELPLDGNFLRRECPNCLRQFKWHDGPTEEQPENLMDSGAYFCPYCGEPAGIDEWWTAEQIDYGEELSIYNASREFAQEFNKLVGNTSDYLGIEVSSADSSPPMPLVEISDMQKVQSPCHFWEPIKITDDWQEPIHCLICGTKYVV